MTPEESLIKPEDIAEIETFKTDPLDLEHVKYIVDKVEKAQGTNKKEPFKPYKTTKSNVHDPMKEKQRKLHKNWEVTAATPPLTVHGAAKVLSLNESLKLQKEQTEKLQVFDISNYSLKLFRKNILCWITIRNIVNLFKIFDIQQEIQAKHAVERLASQVGLYGICSTPRNVDNYRSQYTNGLPSSSSSSDNEEDHEVHDEEDNDRGGTVVFTVDSIEN